MKTINIEFYGHNYNLALYISKYANNGRLYVGAISMGEYQEPFCDISVNIPLVELEKNEIILEVQYTTEIRAKLIDLGIIEPTKKTCNSGFNTYEIVKFNLEKANEYILKSEV